MKKVGIYSGTFDPVHNGHLEFAKAAKAKAGLDKIYFLPERQPRGKSRVTDYKHRLKMLELAIQGQDFMEILELPEDSFNVQQTLPALKKKLPKAELYFLFGSDIAKTITDWPGAKKLLGHQIIVGVRGNKKIPKEFQAVTTDYHYISSSVIRHARWTNAVPEVVVGYISQKNLYRE